MDEEPLHPEHHEIPVVVHRLLNRIVERLEGRDRQGSSREQVEVGHHSPLPNRMGGIEDVLSVCNQVLSSSPSVAVLQEIHPENLVVDVHLPAKSTARIPEDP